MKLLNEPANGYGAGCGESVSYFQKANRFGSVPKIGAQIFLKNSKGYYHTGIVYDVNSSYVYTIEGNMQCAKGYGVGRNKYPINSTLIGGYGYPNYDDVSVSDDPSAFLEFRGITYPHTYGTGKVVSWTGNIVSKTRYPFES